MTTALTVETLDLEEGEEMMQKFGKHFPSYLSGYDKTGAPGVWLLTCILDFIVVNQGLSNSGFLCS